MASLLGVGLLQFIGMQVKGRLLDGKKVTKSKLNKVKVSNNKKSRIRETPNLSTDADSSTATYLFTRLERV